MHEPRPLENIKILYLCTPEQRKKYPHLTEKAPDVELFPRGHHDAIECPEVLTRNYGIVLDRQFIVVDIDAPDLADNLLIEPTWYQKTRKGFHYLFLAPKNCKAGNTKLYNSKGQVYGDIKTKGYIVGPGSTIAGHTYGLLSHMFAPVPCPRNILDLLYRPKSQIEKRGEWDGIPAGEHDDSLAMVAGFLRGKLGLSKDAIAAFLEDGALSVLKGVDPDRPYTGEDFERIADSASKYAAGKEEAIEVLTKGFQQLGSVSAAKDVTKWILHRFVPQGELVLMYGAGGIGKSSWASWLAAHSAAKGKTFGFCGIEEPFIRFGVRAWLGNKDTDLFKIYDIGNQWMFPRDAERLKEALLATPIDILYFDSIYNHFEPIEGQNLAEKARTCLTPLARIAQELKITIVGTFHENKAGDFLGSVEMVNVARVVLHATRTEGDIFKVKVKKTNFIDPGYGFAFTGDLIPGEDFEGNPWLEEDENGEIVPEQVYVIQDYYKTTGEAEIEKKDEQKPKWIDSNQI